MYFTVTPFHKFHHCIKFAYFIIPDYLGKLYKLVQNYQGTDESLLYDFEKVEVLKGADVVEVT